MKKIISLLVSLTLILSIVPMTVMADDTGWDGTTATACTNGDGLSADTAYKISTPEELAWARNQINDGTAASAYFELTADIDLNNQEWVPIGTTSNSFTGTFNGKGYAVKNIKITTAYADGTGFFGQIANGKVQNLGIENLDMDVPSGNAGGMVGRAYGTFTNCYVKNSSVRNTANTTSSYPGIAGFIGYLRNGITATNCYVYNTEIAGPQRSKMGGFCGFDGGNSDASVFTNCYVAGIKEVPETNVVTPSRYGFAQKMSSTDKTSAVNCWSTLESGVGTYIETNSGYLYNAEKEIGLSGATKEGIITALVTDGGSYIVDEDVNDGYPCLDYEKPALVAASSFAGGDGKSADTAYQIATAEQLALMRNKVNDGSGRTAYYELTADVDLDNKEWTPIGLSTSTFGGTLDGKGHKVCNIKITTATKEGTGFFGVVNGGTVKNLGIDNINITVPSGNVGGMVGKAIGTFTNCYVKNSTICNTTTSTGAEYNTGVGGFIGYQWAAVTATNCYVYNVQITAPPRGKAGGFCGYDGGDSDSGVFTNCYAAAVTEVPLTKTEPVRYGFAHRHYKETDKTTAVNCYSTMTSSKGTYGESGNRAYNEALELGKAGALIDDIVAGLVTNLADTVYKADESINGGFPALNYETAPVVETVNPYVIAAVNTNGMVKVSILENSAVTGASVYVASYDVNGRLLNADILPATVGTQTSEVDATGATTIKVFVWGPNQTPIANMYSK